MLTELQIESNNASIASALYPYVYCYRTAGREMFKEHAEDYKFLDTMQVIDEPMDLRVKYLVYKPYNNSGKSTLKNKTFCFVNSLDLRLSEMWGGRNNALDTFFSDGWRYIDGVKLFLLKTIRRQGYFCNRAIGFM